MKHISLILTLVVTTTYGLHAIEKHKAAYTGGTIATFNAEGGSIGGRIETSDPDRLVFIADERPLADMPLRVEYTAIQHVEFGQTARRRVKAAIGASALFGPIGLVALRSKERAHYLTIAYRDEIGVNQAVVLELGKSVVRDTLAIVEARSGKAIEYQDEEARKWSK
jgi:hypothetical protein